jgi:N-formylglutamate amidohydrolase
MDLWTLAKGDAPLIVDVPHCGTRLPEVLRARLTPEALAMPDTDWHVEKLYDFVRPLGVTLMCATHSRYVVDLNRDPSGAVLYPGADNSEICPTRTFLDAPIYRGVPPDAVEIEQRVATWWTPYHARLAEEIERVHARHGYAVLLDGHSILSEVPRFFTGRLPDLNLGTVDGRSCDPRIAEVAASVIGSAPGFTSIVNGRFKGGYITRRFGDPARGVHALQLEMAMSSYLDEREPLPYAWDPGRARTLQQLLERLVQALLAWRP